MSTPPSANLAPSWSALRRAVDDDPHPLVQLCLDHISLSEGKGRGSRNADWRWRENDSLALYARSRVTGGPAIKDWREGTFSDALTYATRELGIAPERIADLYADSHHLEPGLSDAERARRIERDRASAEAKRAKKIAREIPAATLERLFKESKPAAGHPIAKAYAGRRGGIPLPAGVRFHVGPEYVERGKLVKLGYCLVAFGTDRTGAIVGCQFIQLTLDGRKIEGRLAKRSLGPVSVGYVCLGNLDSQRVYIAEGLETGCSILAADPEALVLVCLGGLRFDPSFPAIANAELVTLCMDIDTPKKLEKMHELIRRHRSIKFEVALPGDPAEVLKGYDFNDLLCAEGLDAVRAALDEAYQLDLPPILGEERQWLDLGEAEAKLAATFHRIKTEGLTPLVVQNRAEATVAEVLAKVNAWYGTDGSKCEVDAMPKTERKAYRSDRRREAKRVRSEIWQRHGYERPISKRKLARLLLMRVAIGLGKSTGMLRLLAELPGQHPDIQNGHELDFGALRGLFLTQSQKQAEDRMREFIDFVGDPAECGRLLGRQQANPDGEIPLERLARLGLGAGDPNTKAEDVLALNRMCVRKDVDPFTQIAAWTMSKCRNECPVGRAGECAYLKQFPPLKSKRVIFAPHAFIGVGYVEKIGRVDFAIVDEQFQSPEEKKPMGASVLDTEGKSEWFKNKGPKLRHRIDHHLLPVVDKIAAAFTIREPEPFDERGPPQRRATIYRIAYSALDVTEEDLKQAIECAEDASDLNIRGYQTAAQLAKIDLRSREWLGKVLPILRTIKREMFDKRWEKSGGLIKRREIWPGAEADVSEDRIHVAYQPRLKLSRDLPVIVLDATGDPLTTARALRRSGEAELIDIQVKHGTPIKTIPKRCSNAQMLRDDDKGKALRAEVAGYVGACCRGRSSSLFTTKPTERKLAALVPDTAKQGHFGNLRSDNTYQNEVTAVAGTPHVPGWRLELQTAAGSNASPEAEAEPVTLHDWRAEGHECHRDGYPRQLVSVPTTDGTYRTVSRQYHPDARTEASRSAASEGETLNAIGRARDLRNPGGDLNLIGEHVLPGYVHDFLPPARLRQGIAHRFRWQHEIAREDSVFLLSPTHAAECVKMDDGAPMWPSADAARKELTRFLETLGLRFDHKKGVFERLHDDAPTKAELGKVLLGIADSLGSELRLVAYKVDGGRGWFHALLISTATWLDLEAKLGRPITEQKRVPLVVVDRIAEHRAWIDLYSDIREQPGEASQKDVGALAEALAAAVDASHLEEHERQALLDGIERHAVFVPGIDRHWRDRHRK